VHMGFLTLSIHYTIFSVSYLLNHIKPISSAPHPISNHIKRPKRFQF